MYVQVENQGSEATRYDVTVKYYIIIINKNKFYPTNRNKTKYI